MSFTIPTRPGMCQPVATGGYLGAENQMIRVKVAHVDTTTNVPTIVWGFDDASFLYRVQAATGNGSTTLTLASAPVDIYHNPALGQAVELLRDAVQLTATQPVATLASPAGFVSDAHRRLRRDQHEPRRSRASCRAATCPRPELSRTPQLYLRVWQATVARAGPGDPWSVTPASRSSLTLSSSNGAFHVGDFWRFALRPSTRRSSTRLATLTRSGQPPDGPRTWGCPLAVLTWDDGSATASSCVPQFSGLVELTGAEGGCCTLDVGPGDVDDGASLQALLDAHAHPETDHASA